MKKLFAALFLVTALLLGTSVARASVVSCIVCGNTNLGTATINYAVISGTDFLSEVTTHNIGFSGAVPGGTLDAIPNATLPTDFVYLYQLVNLQGSLISDYTIAGAGISVALALVCSAGAGDSNRPCSSIPCWDWFRPDRSAELSVCPRVRKSTSSTVSTVISDPAWAVAARRGLTARMPRPTCFRASHRQTTSARRRATLCSTRYGPAASCGSAPLTVRERASPRSPIPPAWSWLAVSFRPPFPSRQQPGCSERHRSDLSVLAGAES